MISVEEASGLIAQHTARPRVAEVKLADALGRTLAADVASDVDSPPCWHVGRRPASNTAGVGDCEDRGKITGGS